MPGKILLQFYDGHAAFALTRTSKAEALDHAIAAQMLVDRRAQRTRAVSVDQINDRLTVQNGAVDK